MHSTIPPSPPQPPTESPNVVDTGSPDTHGSPKSLASGLSSSSSSSSSAEDASHATAVADPDATKMEDRRMSRHHDIDYLKTLANAGVASGSYKIVAGNDAREFVGMYAKDAQFRNRTGPVVIARSAVTDTGRKLVDYARTWRGDTKAHRNKGPRKDFLSAEFRRAEQIQNSLEERLREKVPDDQAAKHDRDLKRAVKDLDNAFKRMSLTAEELANSSPKKHHHHHSPRSSTENKKLPPSPLKNDTTLQPPASSHSPGHSPSKHPQTLPLPNAKGSHSKSAAVDTHLQVRVPSSATASVQSIPFLGPIHTPSPHEHHLRIVNPDPRQSTLDGDSYVERSGNDDERGLTIVLIDDTDEDYKDWDAKHPTPVVRRAPVPLRKSDWDGTLQSPLSASSHSRDTEKAVRDHHHHHQDSPPPPLPVIPSGSLTPPRASPITPRAMTTPMSTASLLDAPGLGFQSHATGYTPQSIYAPPATQPATYPSVYAGSAQSSPYTMSPSTISYSSVMSPYGGSNVTLSPQGGAAQAIYPNYAPPSSSQQYSPYPSPANLSPYSAVPMNLVSPLYQYTGL